MEISSNKPASRPKHPEQEDGELLFCSEVTAAIFGKIEWQSKRRGTDIPARTPAKFPVFIHKSEIQQKAKAYTEKGKDVPSWLEKMLCTYDIGN